jgi:hypothetical protein
MKFDFTGIAPRTKVKSSKDAIIERIDDGKVVPILGTTFTDDLAFSSHQALVQGWSNYTRYPLPDLGHGLAQVAQYISVSTFGEDGSGDPVRIKEIYLGFLKAALQLMAEQDTAIHPNLRAEVEEQERDLTVSKMARRFGYPSLDSPQSNPLLVLAAMPLPIYVTTCYHDFLEVALRERGGKDPQTEVCVWHDGLRSLPSIFAHNPDYEPTPERPLVYHLHGFDAYPESLVLTEDDYLDFLTNISKDNRAIHPRVRQALTDSSLVMIGYHPQDWDFRVIFRGLVVARPPGMWKTSIAIQLEHEPMIQEYVQRYLRQAKFDVEWKEAGDFIMDLYSGWRGG